MMPNLHDTILKQFSSTGVQNYGQDVHNLGKLTVVWKRSDHENTLCKVSFISKHFVGKHL